MVPEEVSDPNVLPTASIQQARAVSAYPYGPGKVKHYEHSPAKRRWTFATRMLMTLLAIATCYFLISSRHLINLGEDKVAQREQQVHFERMLKQLLLQERELSALRDIVYTMSRTHGESTDRMLAEVKAISKQLATPPPPPSISKWEAQVRMQGDLIGHLRLKVASLEAVTETRLIEPVDPDARLPAQHQSTWKQHSFSRHGAYGFILYSGYRMGPKSFAGVGLGLLEKHDNRDIGLCRWLGQDGHQVNGSLRMTFPLEHHTLRYEVAIAICELEQVVLPGGFVLGKLDQEEIVFYREDPGMFQSAEFPDVFPSELTVCTAPIFGTRVLPSRIREFVEYHKLLGADHYIFYDAGGVDSMFLKTFEEDIIAGSVQITPFADNEKFETWYHGQLLAQTDCLYRTRYSSKWLMMADFDEFFWIRNKEYPKSIPALLKRFQAPVVSFGCYYFTIEKCRPEAEQESQIRGDTSEAQSLQVPPWGERGEGDLFTLEKLVYRWPHVICWENLDGKYDPKYCPFDLGHRKFFVDPRRVERMGIHGVVIDNTIPPPTEHLSTDDVAQAHFQMLFVQEEVCNETVRLADTLDWWEDDLTLPRFARSLRKGHRCDFSPTGTGCTAILRS